MSGDEEVYRLLRENYAELGEIGEKLLTHERKWRSRYHFLLSHGYRLRPRYHPDWEPSWRAHPNRIPLWFEDYWPWREALLIDATREDDGQHVCLKIVPTSSSELAIARYFSRPEVQSDPRNHCVPLLDSFDDEDNGISYLVMPLLREPTDPDFLHVDDVLEFTDQVLEGLAFMHEHSIAHRDIAISNILMDGRPLYPDGWHPVRTGTKRDCTARSIPIYRIASGEKIRYYIIDFGMSVYIPPGVPRRILGNRGADREAPELSVHVPYDPFPTDVFILGNALRKAIDRPYFRVSFLRPLISAMVDPDPGARPTVEDALGHWREIRKQVSVFQRYTRLRLRGEDLATALVLDIVMMYKIALIFVPRLFWRLVQWLQLATA